MQRRDFLRASVALAALPCARAVPAEEPRAGEIVTVTGPVEAGELGRMLPHEHVMVDFIGAEQASSSRYDRDTVFEAVLPYLKRLRDAGCAALAECTPAFLARDPALLRRLSMASGVRLLTNTGYYGARQGKYLPRQAFEEDADQLAQRWLTEWEDGIDGTGIRPGFIKIGVDAGPLSEVNQKLVRAAARTHLESGLTVACHTGDGAAALQEMAILQEEGVDAAAWIWVHAQNERDQTLHERAAERGGWVEFDGVAPRTIERHVVLVRHMKQKGLLGRVLISQDAGWYSVGEPGGGTFRPYTLLYEQFLPALKQAGLTDEDLRRLTVENPAQAFTVRVRAR